MNAQKRCVFCGHGIHRASVSQWKCGDCGLVYGVTLMTDKKRWAEFRRRALVVLTVARLNKTDAEIRPTVGIILAAVIEGMQDDEEGND